MIWATVSSRSYLYWLYTASPSSATKNIINLISVLTIWWCPCEKSSLPLLKKFAWTSAFSWQSSVSLCPAPFCTPRANLSVTSGISWLPNLHSNPLWWKWYLCFAVSSQRSRSSQDHSTSASLASEVGHRLELLWYWMACIGNGPRSLSFLRLYQTTSFRTMVDKEGYSISSMGLVLPVVDIMVIWIKFTHSCPF